MYQRFEDGIYKFENADMLMVTCSFLAVFSHKEDKENVGASEFEVGKGNQSQIS